MVAVDADGRRRRLEVDGLAAPGGERRDRGDGPAGQLGRVEAAQLEDDRAGPEAGDLEDVADDPLHPVGVALDRGQQRRLLLRRRRRLGVAEQADAGADRRERGPQLVGDRREEVGSQPLQLGQVDG